MYSDNRREERLGRREFLRAGTALGLGGSSIDNGRQIRELLASDGRVLACFSGHKHRNRRTVYGKTHYITMAATH